MGNPAALDFSVALIVARLQPCPSDQVCRTAEVAHVRPDLRNDGCGRAFLDAGNGHELFELPRERLLAQADELLLAMVKMGLGHVYLLQVLAEAVDVHGGVRGCQRTRYGLEAVLAHGAAVDALGQFPGIRDARDDGVKHLAVAPAADVRDVVAQTHAAALKRRVELRALVHQLLVQVEDASVVLAHLLDGRFGT